MEYIGEVFEINFIHSVRVWTTLTLLGSVFLLSGCNPNQYNTNNVENPPSGTSQRNNLPTELPTPIIQSVSGTPIPAVKGSYCWEGLCVDYAGDLELLEGITPVTLLVGEDVSIHMGTDVAPDEFTLVEYVDGKAHRVSLTAGSFQLAQETGIHYYGAFARWSSPKDSNVSLGDTSFAFAVHLVEKK
ncbi:hypothetical protein [Paenibacillus xylanilyticus]|uniref:hypothetical protein n=1 Tax=Paenibacillus xylanilyticus TaxID=248903 RepID=UPI003AB0CC42